MEKYTNMTVPIFLHNSKLYMCFHLMELLIFASEFAKYFSLHIEVLLKTDNIEVDVSNMVLSMAT